MEDVKDSHFQTQYINTYVIYWLVVSPWSTVQ